MNRIYIVFILSILFSACQKEDEIVITESQINYEINGVPYQLKSKSEITFSFVGAIQTVGKEQPTNWLFLETPNLLIRIKEFTNSTPISAGTYAGIVYDTEGNIKGVELSYTNENNEYYESTSTNSTTEVVINTISRNGVKGTFRGWVVYNQDTIKFENGSFSIYTYKN